MPHCWKSHVAAHIVFFNLFFTACLARDKLYLWVQGLGSVPDVPHAVNVSFVTEGNGVGVSKEPPVNVKDIFTDNVCAGALASNSQVR